MRQEKSQIYLIPDRECGACTACCVSLTINTCELVKLPNTPCHNLLPSGGCKIYKTRPETCNKWYCAWRFMPSLNDNWRPDKSGILLEFCQENFPAPFTGKVGIKFTILDEKKALNFKNFYTFLTKQISNGTPCLLSYGNKPAELPAIAFLNIAVYQAVKSEKIHKVKKAIEKAIEACKKQPIEKLALHEGKLVSDNSM